MFVTIYFTIGIVIFALSQAISWLGAKFDDDRIRPRDTAMHIVIFGLLWWVGIGFFIWALLPVRKKRRRGRRRK